VYPASRMVDLSIVILNYNTRSRLMECLRSLRSAGLPGVSRGVATEIYVVDNASGDGSVEAVEADFPDVSLVRAPRNGGFAYGNNLALRRASGRFAVLLNPDTVVPPGGLESLVHYMDAHPRVGACGPRLQRRDGSLDLACRRSFPTLSVSLYRLLGLSHLFPRSRRFGRYNLTYLDPSQEAEVDSVVGACMLVRREAMEQVGLLDEAFFLYGEDLDWAYRMKQRGWSVVYVPSVTILHHKGESSRQQSTTMTLAFYDAMRIFYRKHYARQHPAVVNALVEAAIWARCGVSLLKNGLRPPERRRVAT
jgi:N-acetylglucosaminyl-diphospho-decaprenol L-rhamnosyltransferase